LLERKGDRERGKRECVSRKSVRAVRAQERGEGKGEKGICVCVCVCVWMRV